MFDNNNEFINHITLKKHLKLVYFLYFVISPGTWLFLLHICYSAGQLCLISGIINAERCESQAYAVFLFIWTIVVPLAAYVIGFSKILAVIRRQAKVKPIRRRNTTVKPVDASTVAPTTTTAISSVSNLSPSEEIGPRHQRQAQYKGVSQTEINVVKTMLFIVICFSLCWVPRTFDLIYMKLIVSHFSHF